MAKFEGVWDLAKALYEGLPSLQNLAESLARQYGKASALSFFEMMGDEEQFFWCDIAIQIIEHSKCWEENQGSCCVMNETERARINREIKFFVVDAEGKQKPTGICHSCSVALTFSEMKNVNCPYCGEQI